MALAIHALSAGTIRNFPVAAVQYQRGWGEFHDVPLIMFVITGGEHPIVVDSGAPDVDLVRRHHGYQFERNAAEEPLNALRELGVDPDDVGTVINTHLHWDHCGNNQLFPGARILVQREELRFAVDPIDPVRVAYENTALVSPPWSEVLNRFRTVDGDVPVTDGIALVHLPGHTPGSQGVLVETGSDTYLLAGDCVDTMANWDGDEKLRHIPSGSFTNLIDYVESFSKIERLGATVIPAHDPVVLETGVFG